jgi:hypothetical protein
MAVLYMLENDSPITSAVYNGRRHKQNMCRARVFMTSNLVIFVDETYTCIGCRVESLKKVIVVGVRCQLTLSHVESQYVTH